MIVSIVWIYDTCLGDLFVGLFSPLLFSSILNHLWCLVLSLMMGIEVHYLFYIPQGFVFV